jgi:hypothetical protein
MLRKKLNANKKTKNDIYLNNINKRIKNTIDSNLFNKILSLDHFLET